MRGDGRIPDIGGPDFHNVREPHHEINGQRGQYNPRGGPYRVPPPNRAEDGFRINQERREAHNRRMGPEYPNDGHDLHDPQFDRRSGAWHSSIQGGDRRKNVSDANRRGGGRGRVGRDGSPMRRGSADERDNPQPKRPRN